MIWQCSRDEGPEWQSGSHEVANGQLEFRGRIAPARVAAERVEDLVFLALPSTRVCYSGHWRQDPETISNNATRPSEDWLLR